MCLFMCVCLFVCVCLTCHCHFHCHPKSSACSFDFHRENLPSNCPYHSTCLLGRLLGCLLAYHLTFMLVILFFIGVIGVVVVLVLVIVIGKVIVIVIVIVIIILPSCWQSCFSSEKSAQSLSLSQTHEFGMHLCTVSGGDPRGIPHLKESGGQVPSPCVACGNMPSVWKGKGEREREINIFG